jgi:hypothetical protein
MSHGKNARRLGRERKRAHLAQTPQKGAFYPPSSTPTAAHRQPLSGFPPNFFCWPSTSTLRTPRYSYSVESAGDGVILLQNLVSGTKTPEKSTRFPCYLRNHCVDFAARNGNSLLLPPHNYPSRRRSRNRASTCSKPCERRSKPCKPCTSVPLSRNPAAHLPLYAHHFGRAWTCTLRISIDRSAAFVDTHPRGRKTAPKTPPYTPFYTATCEYTVYYTTECPHTDRHVYTHRQYTHRVCTPTVHGTNIHSRCPQGESPLVSHFAAKRDKCVPLETRIGTISETSVRMHAHTPRDIVPVYIDG